MMMTACNDGGRRRVYESDDMGDSWTEALGTLSRVWGNKQGESVKHVRSGFTKATIDGVEDRDVMLVTLPVYANEIGNKKGKLHLWLTDNTHIVDIGPVSGDEEDDAAASSLLYKSGGSGDNEENNNEELIALYEKKGDGENSPSGIFSVRLTKELQRVKAVLATWKEVDKRVSQLCLSLNAQEDASPEGVCGTDFDMTAGLVGFLSGNFSSTTWRDEYLGVNARVKGIDENKKTAAVVTESSDGVRFQGAWAEWPVGDQGENQLYHFANYNFTLVATVSIDGVPEGDTTIPVMGVKMSGAEKTVFFGLSYNSKDKKWKLLHGGENCEELSSILRPDTNKHVVILLRNGSEGSAYVDGERVGHAPCQLKNTDSKEISHFYIGGNGGSAGSGEGVSVTVTNVLLYNRPLDGNDIGALSANKAFISPPVIKNGQGKAMPSSHVGQPEQQEKSLGISGADGASTTSVSSVSTPLLGEESAKQLASGPHSEGTQNVNGNSSSDGNQTVEAEAGGESEAEDGPAVPPEMRASSGEHGERAGGTNEQEEVRPQVKEVNAA
ncbi:trans-sialidase, putative, partial [Trypanosoma cruzi marinkellei]